MPCVLLFKLARFQTAKGLFGEPHSLHWLLKVLGVNSDTLFSSSLAFLIPCMGASNDILFSSFLAYCGSWPNRRTMDVSVIGNIALQTLAEIFTSLLEGQIHACFVLGLSSQPIASFYKEGDISFINAKL